MQDLKRVRFVTENYHNLQGLKMVPLGLWFVAAGAGDAGWWPWFFKTGRPVSHLLGLGLAWFLSWLIGRYYKYNYGQVQPSPQTQRKGRLVTIVGLPALLIALAVDWSMKLPVSLVALLITAYFLTAYLCSSGRFRKHYVVIALLFAGLGLMPLLLRVPLSDRIWGPGGVMFTLLLGLGLIAGGILDHLLLVRTLKPLPEASDG